jgi:hypothetical protein
MRLLRALSARRTLVALVLIGTVMTGIGAPRPVGAEASAAPVLVSGDVPDGADVVGVTVTIDPKDSVLRALKIGETAPPVLSPSVTAAISGTHYEVRLDPTSIPRTYMSADGVIYAMVTVFRVDEPSVATTTSARAVADPRTGDTVWVDALESAQAVADSGTTNVAGRSFPAVLGQDSTTRTAAVGGVHLLKSQYDPMFRSSYTDTPAGCSDRKVAERVRDTTIGTTYPVAGDEAGMQVNSSTGASYGTAFTAKRPGAAFAEFKAGESKYTRSGWGFDWAGSSAQRSYRKGVLYGKFIRSCVQYCDGCFMFWKPIGETGGTGSNTRGVNRPDWTWCRRIDVGRWYRDQSTGRNYEYDAAVKFADVIGIDLAISREYNHSQKVWYQTPVKRRMCGNNDWPSLAGKVMERR